MLNLFENYTEREKDLIHSLEAAGQKHPTVVLNDHGFLPSSVVSPVGFFTGMDYQKKKSTNKPRFFNALALPAYWEIRGSGQSADIFEGYKQKGHIRYSERPGDYRVIQAVEWFNEAGRVRAVDLYNQKGMRFAQETYSDGVHTLTTYFDAQGREVLLYNLILQSIQLNYKGKNYLFSDYSSFVLFYLKVAKLPTQRILYNSLGRPHFVTHALQAQSPKKKFAHLLFWQETSQKIPGNMKAIFEATVPATTQIIVQDQAEYERLRLQMPQTDKVTLSYLGYLYAFKRQELIGKNVHIHTNSDQLEGIQELVQSLSDFEFHISARTEMSQKLMHLEGFDNVSLYPNISDKELHQLISESSFYLDINQGGELDNIIRQAFEHNVLLLGFTQTLHHSRLMSSTFVFDNQEVSRLVDTLQKLDHSTALYHEALTLQQEAAGQMTVGAYKEVIQ